MELAVAFTAPGGAVSAPRLIKEVKPKYTSEALANSIQGTVVLEVIVTGDGCASQIRIVRSLDAGGLDEEAVAAVAQWRFEPGRLGAAPVDVLVTIMLDFTDSLKAAKRLTPGLHTWPPAAPAIEAASRARSRPSNGTEGRRDGEGLHLPSRVRRLATNRRRSVPATFVKARSLETPARRRQRIRRERIVVAHEPA